MTKKIYYFGLSEHDRSSCGSRHLYVFAKSKNKAGENIDVGICATCSMEILSTNDGWSGNGYEIERIEA